MSGSDQNKDSRTGRQNALRQPPCGNRSPRLPVEPQSVARDLFGPRQHFIDLRRDSIRLARLRDFLNRGRQAWSERFGERLREEMLADYRRLCAEMEQRKPTRLPQRWVLVGNRAASLGCDSIAVDCMNRFLSYHPSPRLVAHASTR